MQQHYREESGLPSYLLPFCISEGEYYAVAGANTATETSPVFFIDETGELTLAFNSVTNMMLALAECYETGVYAVNGDGFVEVVDEIEFGKIRLKHNSGTASKLHATGW